MTNSLDITINNTLESIKGVRVIRAYNMKIDRQKTLVRMYKNILIIF